jgi:hypothetical protein
VIERGDYQNRALSPQPRERDLDGSRDTGRISSIQGCRAGRRFIAVLRPSEGHARRRDGRRAMSDLFVIEPTGRHCYGVRL